MAGKKRKERSGTRAAKPPSSRRAAQAARSARPRQPTRTEEAAEPLLTHTRAGFAALRARRSERTDVDASPPGETTKRVEAFAEALTRLEADYERVLKRR